MQQATWCRGAGVARVHRHPDILTSSMQAVGANEPLAGSAARLSSRAAIVAQRPYVTERGARWHVLRAAAQARYVWGALMQVRESWER
jgi:hypothetical protein